MGRSKEVRAASKQERRASAPRAVARQRIFRVRLMVTVHFRFTMTGIF